MVNKSSTLFTLVLLVALLVGVVIINNQTLHTVRADLTEDQVYSLSQGSLQVIQQLDEPVTLYYFFSDEATKNMTALRNYATRVQSLLEEYAQQSGGKIRLQVIDPEPFSQAEDQAAQFGLTAASLGSLGEPIYFGLAGTNALDDQFSIGFFDPQKERFLEYDISQLIYQLSSPEPIQLTIVSDLPLTGGQNPMTGQFDQPMTFYTQLQDLYDVTVVSTTAEVLPEQTDVLMLLHPQNISEPLRYALDQYVMQGGRVVAFVDPHYESDPMATMGGQSNASDTDLLRSWGIAIDPASVVLDAQLGLEIRAQDGGIIRHPGFIGLTADELSVDDQITANLELINGASFGAVELAPDSKAKLQPLVVTSNNANLIDASLYAQTRDPKLLQAKLAAAGEQYVLAARVTGTLTSAFEGPLNDDEPLPYVAQSANSNLVVVADADMLANRFWVQQSNFFGQVIATPFANNGDLIVNAAENLSGSDALISVRSRGTYARPFERVEALQVAAEARFREQEERLQQQLQQTEQQLAQLQGQQAENGLVSLTPAQQKTLDEFVQQRSEIRQELRDVRYQLDKDIDRLGNWLKLLNIAVAPIVLTTLLWLLFRLFRRRAPRKLSEVSA